MHTLIRRITELTALVIIAAILYVVIMTIAHTPNAKSDSDPAWTGVAATVNYACFHHGGVQQISDAYAGASGIQELVVVCEDHFARQLIG